MCSNGSSYGIPRVRAQRSWLVWGLTVLAVATFALPAQADRRDFGHRNDCPEVIEEFSFVSPVPSNRTVLLDEIVPLQLQGMIRTDRESLTGVWVSDISLFTTPTLAACQIPKIEDCEGGLEGACPTDQANGPVFDCSDSVYWASNTMAIYELTTGAIYGLDAWRIWNQATFPTEESILDARPPSSANGYVFMNGARNKDDSILMISSIGEVLLSGDSTGAHPELAERVVAAGRVYDSNVGRVIITNMLTDTALSLIYAPTSPREGVWMINFRKARSCVDGTNFKDLIFPPKRKIKIKQHRR